MKKVATGTLFGSLSLIAGSSFASDGKSVCQGICVGRHGTGRVTHRSTVGDEAAWVPCIAEGVDVLLQSAVP